MHSNRHHVIPKSRIPRIYKAGKNKLLSNWLVIIVPIVQHNAFHAIFGNRTPDEQLIFLKKLCGRNGYLNKAIYDTYGTFFDCLFGAKSFKGMAESLKRWDLSVAIKENYSKKLSALLRVLNRDFKGGIPIKKFKLN